MALKGHIPWNKGKTKIYSERTLHQMSKSMSVAQHKRYGTIPGEVYKRRCPNCGKEIYYALRYRMTRAERTKCWCRKCRTSGENNGMYGKKRPKFSTWLKENNPMKDPLVREKVSKSLSGTNGYYYGKTLPEWHVNLIRARRAGFRTYEEFVQFYPKKKEYRLTVWRETRKTLKQNPVLPNFDKRGKSGTENAYQLDHIISIDHGFKNNIPAREIGAYKNLRMIPWQENIHKKGRCV